ncbi:winged helix-turn-helix transcriptional regulator [Haloarchaeobius sp. HME9146]|uniref:winged helix-turn-helix transcriptional regulator n=1 Tax=unclassified Haloarchaeobius TaxID=2614452 RepID=UPI0021BE72E6|nr:helix-turn-helix domain-containing protein [Haloarchaeobius sp. HME9146]MCT9098381.1 helix-turn-helix transcriptional regulator [Haloarchaeobius sp. HME9146]
MEETTKKSELWYRSDDWCSITAASNVLGKKWVPAIVHRLLKNEALGFSALREEIYGVSSKVLSENLSEMERLGLVERRIISDRPFRVEYSLTERGKDLEAVIDSMAKWGDKHLVPEMLPEEQQDLTEF